MDKNALVSNIILLNKVVGQTPLQALDELRRDRPELENEKLSYAGRLDPMAEGLLLVLVGDENKNRDKYLGLDKEYEVEVLFGVETDSYDILGIPKAIEVPEIIDRSILENLKSFVGGIELPYPPYSSKPVNGRSLFEWARRGELNKINIPNQKFEIKNIELLKISKISTEELKRYVFNSIAKVKGDFRQGEILAGWRKLFETPSKDFTIIKIKVACRSGAYMRSLAHELGKTADTGAIALAIKRTRVGEYSI